MSNKEFARETQRVWDQAKQLKAVKLLRDYDHCFISTEGVTEITKPFGFVGSTIEASDSREHPKGLTLESGPGTSAEGAPAEMLAAEICGRFNVSYAPKFGRGSQLRSCCDALEQAINERGALKLEA